MTDVIVIDNRRLFVNKMGYVYTLIPKLAHQWIKYAKKVKIILQNDGEKNILVFEAQEDMVEV